MQTELIIQKMDSKRNVFILFCSIVLLFFVFGYSYGPLRRLQITESEAMNDNHLYLVPSKEIIEKMDNDTLYLLLDKYVLQNQFYCSNLLRQGPWNASGKTICADDPFKPSSPCIVYSFGSKLDFAFEEASWKSFGCEIHTFDPSLSIEHARIPVFVNYHLIGLSGRDFVQTEPEVWRHHDLPLRKTWKMQRLSSIQKSLSHADKLIDIMKIDIEGWEWDVLSDILQTGAFNNVKQLCLEVHFGFSFKHVVKEGKKLKLKFTKNTWGNVSMKDQIKLLLRLFNAGFRITAKQSFGWGSVYVKNKRIATLVELTLVNINLLNKKYIF
ncbi:probable methyltransferase-like protein 24 isoform X1 [Mercenaria mercenaria]|uniref:probable methyltransferase-like protein 24 isoform X1 n=2 Tax=Mercenaria mercenaria TaxID=6596 RepID=UPI001E1E18F9|nr:probable methyltransferase-like protein 24 isoform X1 [Mercenaria mercenaria]